MCKGETMSKLVQVAKRIIEVLKEEQFELKMCAFAGNKDILERDKPIHECGTSLCIAGALAHLDKYPIKYGHTYDFNYLSYSADLLGINRWPTTTDGEDNIWEYFFGSEWPDDRKQTIKRMEYVIDHGHIIPVEYWPEHGWGE